MNVWFAVRHDDYILIAQFAVQDLAESIRCPSELLLVAQSMLGFKIADQCAQIVGDRL